MPDRSQRLAQILRHRIFAVAAEDVVKAGLQRRRQRAVIAGPKFFYARGVRLLGHSQNVVALLEVEGVAHHVPAFFQGIPIFGARGIFENLDVGNILAQEPQAKGNAPRHLKAPAKSCGSIFAIIVVESKALIDGGKQNAGHGQRLRREGFGRDAPGGFYGPPTLA